MRIYVAGHLEDVASVQHVQSAVVAAGHDVTLDWTRGPDSAITNYATADALSIEIVEDPSPEALLAAAQIWAAATARRDGLSEPVAPERKLPGLRTALAVPGARLHLATQGDLPVGFVVLVPSGSRLELRYLGVTPSAWGDGVATQLLDHVTSCATRGGFDAAELWVLADNDRAIAVYMRAGWVLTSDTKSQIDTQRTETRLELRVGGHARRR